MSRKATDLARATGVDARQESTRRSVDTGHLDHAPPDWRGAESAPQLSAVAGPAHTFAHRFSMVTEPRPRAGTSRARSCGHADSAVVLPFEHGEQRVSLLPRQHALTPAILDVLPTALNHRSLDRAIGMTPDQVNSLLEPLECRSVPHGVTHRYLLPCSRDGPQNRKDNLASRRARSRASPSQAQNASVHATIIGGPVCLASPAREGRGTEERMRIVRSGERSGRVVARETR